MCENKETVMVTVPYEEYKEMFKVKLTLDTELKRLEQLEKDINEKEQEICKHINVGGTVVVRKISARDEGDTKMNIISREEAVLNVKNTYQIEIDDLKAEIQKQMDIKDQLMKDIKNYYKQYDEMEREKNKGEFKIKDLETKIRDLETKTKDYEEQIAKLNKKRFCFF